VSSQMETKSRSVGKSLESIDLEPVCRSNSRHTAGKAWRCNKITKILVHSYFSILSSVLPSPNVDDLVMLLEQARVGRDFNFASAS